VANVLERAVQDEGSEIPPGLNGMSSIDARRLLGIGLLLDPMAVMLIVAADESSAAHTAWVRWTHQSVPTNAATYWNQ
jgi:hypothetical protein